MPVVAVADGIPEQATVGVEQRVVDPPRVDADRLDLGVLAAERTEPVEHLGEDRPDVPAQVAVASNRSVGEAVHAPQGDPIALDQCRP